MVKIAPDATIEPLVRQAEPHFAPLRRLDQPLSRMSGVPRTAAAERFAATVSRLLDTSSRENPTQYLKRREQQAGE